MINSKELHLNEKLDQEIIYTQDYMIICSEGKIYFHKLDELRKKKPKKKVGLSVELVEDITFMFDLINIKEFFNDNNTKDGMRILNV